MKRLKNLANKIKSAMKPKSSKPMKVEHMMKGMKRMTAKDMRNQRISNAIAKKKSSKK